MWTLKISVITTLLCPCSTKAASTRGKWIGVVAFHYDSVYKNSYWAGFSLWALVCTLWYNLLFLSSKLQGKYCIEEGKVKDLFYKHVPTQSCVKMWIICLMYCWNIFDYYFSHVKTEIYISTSELCGGSAVHQKK